MKFSGKIGFVISKEDSLGVHKEKVIERDYVGDFLNATKVWESSSKLNDDITQNSRISIVADPFASENYIMIRFVKWDGVAWKVNRINPQPPRLILTLGEVYNG